MVKRAEGEIFSIDESGFVAVRVPKDQLHKFRLGKVVLEVE